MTDKELMGTVFDISRFCLHDGPGIRTTVFLKGCPLRCAWCHNPEGMSPMPELLYDAAACISCGSCVKVCKQGCHVLEQEKHTYNRKNCVSCGSCVAKCATGALTRAGEKMAVKDVISIVERDKSYYGSDGGLTLSGGEPFYQPDFALALLAAAKKAKLHTCVETSGFCASQVIRDSIPYVDCYLFDCKETDSKRHLSYTGVDFKRIRNNLFLLGEAGCPIILRCPVIPGYNDRIEHMEEIALLTGQISSVTGVALIPYHTLGTGKYSKLGFTPKCWQKTPPDQKILMDFAARLQERTNLPITIEE